MCTVMVYYVELVLLFFAPESVGCLTLDQFVTKPFKSCGNTTQNYHLTACTRMSEFLAKYNSVNIMLDSEAKK